MKTVSDFRIFETFAAAIAPSLGTIAALAIAITLTLGTGKLPAQEPSGPGAFNPEQMRGQMLERLRETFEVKDDAEWKLISERIAKVMDARRATGGMFGGPGFGGPGGPGGFGGRRGGPDGGRPPGGDNVAGPGGPGGFNRQADPEAEALQKSLEAKAPTEEVKAKLAKLRATRRAKEVQLEQAQEELRQILSVRQEAVAVVVGLLK